MRLPDGREVTRTAADVWLRQQSMPGMNMGGMQMAAGNKPHEAKPQKSDGMRNMPGM